jgi:hypothetical protein
MEVKLEDTLGYLNVTRQQKVGIVAFLITVPVFIEGEVQERS